MRTKSVWIARALLFLASMCACRIAGAQVVPDVPALKPAVPARWTITYQDRGAKPATQANKTNAEGLLETDPGAGKDRKLLKAQYETEGKTAHVSKTFSDGTTDQIYIVDKVAYVTNLTTKQIQPEILGRFSGGDLRFAEHYPEFDWLKKQYFVDEQQIGDRKYLHFHQGPSTPKKGRPDDDAGSSLIYDPNFTANDREAWVDEETKLPYAFRKGSVTGTYEHQAPSETISLPASIVKAIRIFNGYTD